MEELVNAAEATEEKEVERLQHQNVILSEAMESLWKTSTKIVDSFDQKKLLYQSSFEKFLKSEEDYTALLTKYANTQFQEVIN